MPDDDVIPGTPIHSRSPLILNASLHLEAETQFIPRLFHVGDGNIGRWTTTSIKVTTGRGGDLTVLCSDPGTLRRLSDAARHCAHLLEEGDAASREVSP